MRMPESEVRSLVAAAAVELAALEGVVPCDGPAGDALAAFLLFDRLPEWLPEHLREDPVRYYHRVFWIHRLEALAERQYGPDGSLSQQAFHVLSKTSELVDWDAVGRILEDAKRLPP